MDFSSRLQSETPRKQPIEKQTDSSQDQIKPNIPQNYLFDSSDEELSPEDEASVRFYLLISLLRLKFYQSLNRTTAVFF